MILITLNTFPEAIYEFLTVFISNGYLARIHLKSGMFEIINIFL